MINRWYNECIYRCWYKLTYDYCELIDNCDLIKYDIKPKPKKSTVIAETN